MWMKWRFCWVKSNLRIANASNPILDANNVVPKTDVNYQYNEALRTKSYTDLWFKVQSHLGRNTNTNNDQQRTLSLCSFPSYTRLSEHLLEPRQETLSSILRDSGPFSVHSLVSDYFDDSLESCRVCGSLLESIERARANHRAIQRVLSLANNDFSHDQCALAYKRLASFERLDNPLSPQSLARFHRAHALHGSSIGRLVSARRRLARRARWCFFDDAERVEWVKAQLDAAAKGAYILDRGFDTVSRMLTRIHDEIEHEKAVIRLVLKNRERRLLREVVREFQMNEVCFMEQLEELEEHVFLCFVTINRARRLVIQEILGGQQQH